MPPASPYRAAFVGGNVGAVVAAVPTALLAFVVKPEDEGFAVLGWAILAMAAVALMAAIGGAVGTYRALERMGAPQPIVTGLAYIPSAALLVATGPGVLAAPLLARWMVCGIEQWLAGDRRAALPQRLLLALVLSGAWVSWAVTRVGYDVGGRVGGSWLVWLVAVSAPTVLCVLLLRGAASPVAILAVVALVGVVAAGGSRSRSGDVHPTPARLAQIADGIPVPDGQRVVDRLTTRTHRPYGPPTDTGPGASMPVHILLSAPVGSVPPPWPEVFVPRADGSLPDDGIPALPPPAGDAGRQAANAWEESLRGAGWDLADGDLYWVARPAAVLLAERGGPLHGKGTWQRAVVLPYGDGAVVFFSTRP